MVAKASTSPASLSHQGYQVKHNHCVLANQGSQGKKSNNLWVNQGDQDKYIQPLLQ